jgi:hypothetical protein
MVKSQNSARDEEGKNSWRLAYSYVWATKPEEQKQVSDTAPENNEVKQ